MLHPSSSAASLAAGLPSQQHMHLRQRTASGSTADRVDAMSLDSSTLSDRLTTLCSASRSHYLVLVHDYLLAARSTTDPSSPSDFTGIGSSASAHSLSSSERGLPSSPSSISLASFTAGAPATVVTSGTLEEDGGLGGLRQRLTEEKVQFIFIKFRGEVIFVHLVPDGISAVQRARSMVITRSLIAQVPYSTPPVLTISHPQQLTDPLIRSKLGAPSSSNLLATPMSAYSFSTPGLSESHSSPYSPTSSFNDRARAEKYNVDQVVPPQAPPFKAIADVPTSVSFTPTIPQNMMMFASDDAHQDNGFPSAKMTPLPSPRTPASFAVGLGMGNVGMSGVFSPVRDLFGEDVYSNASSSSSSLPSPSKSGEASFDGVSHPTAPPSYPQATHQAYAEHDNLSFERRESDTSALGDGAQAPLASFPAPPFRHSTSDDSHQTHRVLWRTASKAGAPVSVEVPWRRAKKLPAPPPKEGSERMLQSNETDHHLRRRSDSYTSPKILPASLDCSSAAPGAMIGALAMGQPSRSQAHTLDRRTSLSASTLSAHSSILYSNAVPSRTESAEEEDKDRRRESLEQERVDFLSWRAEQEKLMLKKERMREIARRKADEAQRERVMRKLMQEQGQQIFPDESGSSVAESESARMTNMAVHSSISPNSRAESSSAPTARSPSGASQRSSNLEAESIAATEKADSDMKHLHVETASHSRRSGAPLPSPSLRPPSHPIPPVPNAKPLPSPGTQNRRPRSKQQRPRTANDGSSRGSKSTDSPQSSKQSLPAPQRSQPEAGRSESANGSRPSSRRMTATPKSPLPPLDARVQAAIEREMRRPVITLEGHVRPRVNRMRARTLTSSVSSSDLRKASSRDSEGKAQDAVGSPLLLSMLAAERQHHEEQRKSKQSTPSGATVPSDWEEERRTQDEDAATGQPLPIIRTFHPSGKPLGSSGWALTWDKTAMAMKDLPAPPLFDRASYIAAAEENREGLSVELREWQRAFDRLLHDAKALPLCATPLPRAASPQPTLIDQIFQQSVKAAASSAAASESSTPSLSSSQESNRSPRNRLASGYTSDEQQIMANREQMRALHERQDVLEAMLKDLQRKRTLRSERESKALERWRKQGAMRASMTESEREQVEAEEQVRRERAEKEADEEEKHVRIITFILLPPSSPESS